MRRRIVLRNCIITIVVGGLLLLCLFLPQYLGDVQDRALVKQIKSHSFDQVSLHGGTNLSESLKVVAGEYSITTLDSGNLLYEKEVVQKAIEFNEFLNDNGLYGLYEDSAIVREVDPLLLISEDINNSIIVWRCSLIDKNEGVLSLLIDDNTGKVLSFSISSQSNDTRDEWDTFTGGDMIYSFGTALAEYYGYQWGEYKESSIQGKFVQNYEMYFITKKKEMLTFPFQYTHDSNGIICVTFT